MRSDIPHPDGRELEVALLFFGQRHLAVVADEPLAAFQMGRAHHRVLFFVARRPGITANGLRNILKITNQSLYRVTNDLLQEKFIEQRPSKADRREKLLFLTGRGLELERECARRQKVLLDKAAQCAGIGSADGFRRMLYAMMTEGDRAEYETFSLSSPTMLDR